MTETAKPAKSRKKLWFTLALIAFNILVLAGIILHEIHGKEEQILDKEIFVTWAANYRFLVYALCCVLCYILFESLKYLIFIRSFAGRWMPMTALKTAILGKYYDFITPLGSGGQPFQIVYLSTQKKIPIGPATSIPLSGMIVYQVGYVCFAISMFVVYACIPHSLPLATPVLYLAGFGAFCYLIVPAIVVLFSVFRETTLKILRFFVKLGHKMRLVKDVDATLEKTAASLDEYRDSFKQLLKKWYILLIGVLLGWLMTCRNCMIAYFVVRASGMSVNWLEMLCLTIFTYCSVTFIPTPGNTGAAEVGFYAVFAGLQSTFWVTMLWRVLSYYSILLIGLCVIVFTPLKRKIQNARANRRRPPVAETGEPAQSETQNAEGAIETERDAIEKSQ